MATAAATATAAQQRRWAHDYETIYILRPNTEPDEADKVAQRVAEVIGRLEGKLVKVDNWGKRKLAYPIKKFTRGVFVYVRYVGYSDVVAELERNLRMLDPVFRYQTVRIAQNVDAAEYTVDPEEVKFLRIEVTEDEEEPNLEQQLGLVGRSSGYGDDERGPEADEAGDEDEDERAERRPPAAAATAAAAPAAATETAAAAAAAAPAAAPAAATETATETAAETATETAAPSDEEE